MEIIKNIEFIINSRNIIRKICKRIKIVKCTIIFKNDYNNVLTFISYWNIVSRIKYFLKKHFKYIKNEYYMISNSENELNVEIIFKINIWKILFVLVMNIQELFEIIKIKRRTNKNGTSNL